ncbi:hypothetical protein BTO18_01240, partial [Polaribacter porphyrae]
INEGETKTLTGNPSGGIFTVVSGGGTINNNIYTPADINTDTTVVIRYTIAADGDCAATSDDVTFTVTPVCDVVADNTTSSASITEGQTKTLTGSPNGGTFSIVSGGGAINNNVYTPADINTDTTVVIRYTIPADGDCVATSDDVTFTVTPVCDVVADNTTSTASINEGETKTLTGNPSGGTFTVVSGGGTINNNVYTPADINTDTTVIIRYTIAADGDCVATSDDVTFTVTPVCSTPVNTISGDIMIKENSSRTSISPISVDAPTDDLKSVRITVSNGTLDVIIRVSNNNPLTRNGAGDITLSGSERVVNGYLRTLIYTPNQNFTGVDTLTMTSTNGCNQTDVDSMNITVIPCPVADNTTDSASIIENETKTLIGTPTGGTFSIVSGGGTINGNVYTPDNINTNTDVIIKYTIAADGSCLATSDDVTFTVTPVCIVANNNTSTATITENDTKTLTGSPAGGTFTIVSGGGTINNNIYTPADINTDTTVVIRYTIAADGSCSASSDDVTFTVTSVGPKVTQDFESGDRNIDIANCWGFGGFTVHSNSKINGNFSARSGAINSTKGSFYLKSPWIELASGNVSFDIKLNNNDNQDYYVEISFIPFDPTNYKGEGTKVGTYTHTLQTPLSSVETVNYAVPSNIANDGNPYRVYLTVYNQNGNRNRRAIIDDWSISGVNVSDKNSNCFPSQLVGSIGDTVWFDANSNGVKDNGENGLEGATVTLDPNTPNDTSDDKTTTTDANGNYIFNNLFAGSYTVSVDTSTVTAGLPNGVTVGQLSQTFDADGTGTANSSSTNLNAGQDRTNQDFGYKACNVADNTTSTTSINESETKTLTGSPNGGTFSIVSGGGAINNNIYTPADINTDTTVVIRYTIAADGSCAATSDNVTFTVTPIIDPCTVGATVGVVTANDPDADGINNVCDLDDDNDGILDTEECEVVIAETPFAVSNGNSMNFTLDPVGNGFVLDVTRMDNSFNLTINGTPLTTQEIQFQQNGTSTGQNIRFKDGSIWGQGGIPQIYQFGNSVNEETPIVRFIIDENLNVKMYASKVANGPLFELELFNGNSFNNFTWNTNSPNNFILSQEVAGPTYINGRVYGTVINCDIDEDGIRNSEDLDSDGDGCLDVTESGGIDTNNDGILDGTGIDTDGKVTGGNGGYNGLDGNEWTAHKMAITTAPTNQTVDNGQPATFSVIGSSETATSYNNGNPIYDTAGNANADIVYQWYLGDPNNGGTLLTDTGIYSGTSSANLTISDATSLNGNKYYVVLTHTNNVCLTESASATLTVEHASIGDTVWYDTNGNGIIDGSESGLEGATITLDPGTPGNTADDITTITDANGNYLFNNLPDGNYTVTVNVSTITSGLPVGVTVADLAQTFDNDGLGTPNTSNVVLAVGENNVAQDFGYNSGLGSIGDTVWYDTDGDGIKDTGESGLGGATVVLDPGTPNNTADDVTTTTDVNGNYLFENLPAGDYTVTVLLSTVTSGIPNGNTVADLVQTFDVDGLGTPSKSYLTLGQGEANLNQDFAYAVPSGGTTGGNSGGVESESLGDAISKIYVGRKKNSVPTVFVKDKSNLYNKSKLQAKQPYQGKGQTMLDMFPTELMAGNIANVTSPTDILDYTIADEVLSVDFSLNNETKGVVLGIKTSDKVYNHTKASCDRLRGAEILNVMPLKVEGYNFLMQAIKQRNGVIEYAVSFAAAKNNNDVNYNIQTRWYVNNYIKYNDMYNFQVWTTRPADTKKLVADVLKNLQSFIPVQQADVPEVPETYASKIYREKGELIVKLRSTEVGETAEISMVELYSETANNIKHRHNTIATEIQQSFNLNIADAYEYDATIEVNGEIEDAFYHADGNWGLDYDKRYTEIKNYFVWNNFDREYNDDEYEINRDVKLKATSDYDYLTLYKSLLPGTLSADYSEYKYLSFTAKGSGLMELGLIKSSIEDWKEQYRVMVDIKDEERTYYIPFEIFSSTGNKGTITADDLTTLTFTFLPVEAQTKELDFEISDLKFTKTAIDEYVVGKVEQFENEFIAYPNPSQGNVKLQLFSKEASKATITLTDITGKVIYRVPAELSVGKNELDLNFNVKPGVMLLQITSEKHDYGTTKMIFR